MSAGEPFDDQHGAGADGTTWQVGGFGAIWVRNSAEQLAATCKGGLPDLRVPAAPTRPDSEYAPLSINDFFLYCNLSQETIDNSVCGHRDPFKNIKRKYVFEVLYGIHDANVYRVLERLQEVNHELSNLTLQTANFHRILSGTPWENRAALLDQLRVARESLTSLEVRTVNETAPTFEPTDIQSLRAEVLRLDQQVAESLIALERNRASVQQLTRLIKQMETQSKRLTKAIIAKAYLTDFDFILCPRCGASIDDSRGTDETCSLCLQRPAPTLDRKEFISEQDRVAAQIDETKELLEAHTQSIFAKEQQLAQFERNRESAAHELDFKTQTYVSDRASAIARAAGERPAILAMITRLEDYLGLFDKLDQITSSRNRLQEEKNNLEGELAALSTRQEVAEQRIRILERNLETILQKLAVPRFSQHPHSAVDRRTYLPVLDGRRFDDLSSQGLQVLVNVAYVIAHQITAIELGLPLPNILLIDGLTTNVGQEGYDVERVHNAYDYLIEIAKEHGDTLQIIVSDGNVPPEAEKYVLLRLSEEDRLIPLPTEAADPPTEL